LRGGSRRSSRTGRARHEDRRAPARLLETFSVHATEWTGSSLGFAAALGIVLVWLATGPFLGYSDTWQLVINTGTTIVTFLMVFLLQRGQNRDAKVVN
jgi:low affinity Fe/Cu permease